MGYDLQSPFGPVPDGWELSRLGELTSKIGSGATPLGGQKVYLPTRTRYALIRSQAVHDRFLDLNAISFITDDDAKRLSAAEVKQGDVLLNITGDGVTFARAAIAPPDALPACVNQHVCILRPRQERLDSGYLLSYLTHPRIKAYIESFNAGGSRRAITKGHIESFLIPLPRPSEQKAIASLLAILDDKIELNRSMNETLTTLIRVSFKDWFLDFGPTRTKTEGGKAYLQSAIWDLFPSSLDDEDKPTGWKTVRLGDLTNVSIGRTPSRSRQDCFVSPPDGLSWLSIKDLGDVAIYAMKSSENLRSEAVEEFRVPVIPSETVVVSFKLTVGRVAITSTAMASNEAIAHLVIPRESMLVSNSYLYCFMNSFRYSTLASTSSIANAVNSDTIRDIRILLPDQEIQRAFEGEMKPLFSRVKANLDESLSLTHVRDLLLPKLMSGEIRLEHAEKKVGELL